MREDPRFVRKRTTKPGPTGACTKGRKKRSSPRRTHGSQKEEKMRRTARKEKEKEKKEKERTNEKRNNIQQINKKGEVRVVALGQILLQGEAIDNVAVCRSKVAPPESGLTYIKHSEALLKVVPGDAPRRDSNLCPWRQTFEALRDR